MFFERGYEVEVDTELYDSECSVVEVEEFAKGVLKGKLEARDYQIQAIAHAIRTKRSLLLSPTASGKSLIIYLLSQYLISKGNKILVVVPTTSLVYQMQTDFQGYGYTDDIRVVTGIEEKTWRNTIKEDIVVTTWQSIYKMPKPWFNQFGAIMGELLDNGAVVKEVAPITWQSYIGNKNLTKQEKLDMKKSFPDKSASWYNNKSREMRKQRTLDFFNTKFGIALESDNVSDAFGLAWYASQNLTER